LGQSHGRSAVRFGLFMITGFHGLHVSAGVIYLCVVARRVWSGFYDRKGSYETVEVTGLYWHFVDLVWVFNLRILLSVVRGSMNDATASEIVQEQTGPRAADQGIPKVSMPRVSTRGSATPDSHLLVDLGAAVRLQHLFLYGRLLSVAWHAAVDADHSVHCW